MKWIEAISSLLDAIAWPVSTLIVIVIFRKKINQLIDRIRAVRTPHGDVDFGESLAKAEDSVDAYFESAEEAASNSAASIDPPLEAAASPRPMPDGLDPSGIVLASWERLVVAITSLQRATAGPGRPSTNISVLLSQLESQGVVNHLFVESTLQLHELRNQVAHALSNPTQGSALAYAKQAEELSRAAEALQQFRTARE